MSTRTEFINLFKSGTEQSILLGQLSELDAATKPPSFIPTFSQICAAHKLISISKTIAVDPTLVKILNHPIAKKLTSATVSKLLTVLKITERYDICRKNQLSQSGCIVAGTVALGADVTIKTASGIAIASGGVMMASKVGKPIGNALIASGVALAMQSGDYVKRVHNTAMTGIKYVENIHSVDNANISKGIYMHLDEYDTNYFPKLVEGIFSAETMTVLTKSNTQIVLPTNIHTQCLFEMLHILQESGPTRLSLTLENLVFEENHCNMDAHFTPETLNSTHIGNIMLTLDKFLKNQMFYYSIMDGGCNVRYDERGIDPPLHHKNYALVKLNREIRKEISAITKNETIQVPISFSCYYKLKTQSMCEINNMLCFTDKHEITTNVHSYTIPPLNITYSEKLKQLIIDRERVIKEFENCSNVIMDEFASGLTTIDGETVEEDETYRHIMLLLELSRSMTLAMILYKHNVQLQIPSSCILPAPFITTRQQLRIDTIEMIEYIIDTTTKEDLKTMDISKLMNLTAKFDSQYTEKMVTITGGVVMSPQIEPSNDTIEVVAHFLSILDNINPINVDTLKTAQTQTPHEFIQLMIDNPMPTNEYLCQPMNI
jgi:hypothetical protein